MVKKLSKVLKDLELYDEFMNRHSELVDSLGISYYSRYTDRHTNQLYLKALGDKFYHLYEFLGGTFMYDITVDTLIEWKKEKQKTKSCFSREALEAFRRKYNMKEEYLILQNSYYPPFNSLEEARKHLEEVVVGTGSFCIVKVEKKYIREITLKEVK